MKLRPALLAVLIAIVTISPAWADEPVAAGWWYRLQAGISPVAIPAPPDAPPDGLYIALDPSGPLAIAAVSYAGTATSEGGTLTLTFASAPKGVPSIDACVATAAVSGASAGAWETQPTHDCDAGRAEGAIAPDGASITFTLSNVFVTAGETIDAVLVPTGSAPFTAPIAKPDASSFAPIASSDTGADGGFVPDDGGFGDDAGAPLGDGSTIDDGGALSPGGAFGGSTPLPDTPVAGGGTGEPGGSTGGGDGGGDEQVAGGPIADTDDESQLAKTVAVALLGALGAAYWFLSNRAEPVPRLIGGLTVRKGADVASGGDIVPGAAPVAMTPAARTAHPVGGLGRFARPRDSHPNRL